MRKTEEMNKYFPFLNENINLGLKFIEKFERCNCGNFLRQIPTDYVYFFPRRRGGAISIAQYYRIWSLAHRAAVILQVMSSCFMILAIIRFITALTSSSPSPKVQFSGSICRFEFRNFIFDSFAGHFKLIMSWHLMTLSIANRLRNENIPNYNVHRC